MVLSIPRLSARSLRGLAPKGVLYPTLVASVIQQSNERADTDATGSYTATEDLVVDLFAWGSGASGNSSNAAILGGGAGSAGRKRGILRTGKSVSWTIGRPGRPKNGPGSNVAGDPGGDTVVIFDGLTMTAQGGRAPTTTVAALRSTATGFDVNRYGGGSGEQGEQGIGGAYVGNPALGGGSPGFPELSAYLGAPGGRLAAVVPYQGPGPGGGGAGYDQTQYSNYGGPGLLVAFMYRINR